LVRNEEICRGFHLEMYLAKKKKKITQISTKPLQLRGMLHTVVNLNKVEQFVLVAGIMNCSNYVGSVDQIFLLPYQWKIRVQRPSHNT